MTADTETENSAVLSNGEHRDTPVVDDVNGKADPTSPAKKQKTMDTTATDLEPEVSSSSSSSLARTRAFGKLILFGEHFVVYQVPALVGAVAAYTDCSIELVADPPVEEENDDQKGDASKEQKKNFTVFDNRPAVPGYKVEKATEGEEAIDLVLKHFKLQDAIPKTQQQQQQHMNLTFGGTLCCVSGIGASAAQCVSLARAIQQTFPAYYHDWTDDDINAAGYEGERGYHGTPSGIDNTAATFGGLLRFQRSSEDGGDPIFVKKHLLHPIRIVYASTGITASTTKVVADVRAKKEANESWFAALLEQYTALVPRAEQAMEEGDMKTLGNLLNDNHTLCQELTVSCKELDDLVQAARMAGAYGAKMSGTGRGGLMLALTPTVELQDAVAAALEQAGAPQVWKTTLE
jgi:mevalonate kinase